MLNFNFYISYLFIIVIQYLLYTLMKKINTIKFNNRLYIDEFLTIMYFLIWLGCINLNIVFISNFLCEEYKFDGYQLVYIIFITILYRICYIIYKFIKLYFVD
jgi:hypothetical protein